MSRRQFKSVLFAFVCFFVSTCPSISQDGYDEKHIEVALRKVGHQVLLSSGDSTSRVLPIINNGDSYIIQFDTEFEFVPENLVATVDRVILETGIAKGYILEVEECETEKVVYSYEVVEIAERNIMTCSSRFQPECCYNLLFTLKEKIDSTVVLNTATMDPLVAAKDESGNINYIALLILLSVIAIGFFFFLKKRNQPTIDPNLLPIGKYHFDKRNTELIIEDQRIELTSKEADLLLFLYNTVNTTVEREVILNMVWGDEGDYVGRTLDVFISKLRKKLEADSSVKIINIRGVGYKLVADV